MLRLRAQRTRDFVFLFCNNDIWDSKNATKISKTIQYTDVAISLTLVSAFNRNDVKCIPIWSNLGV